MSKINILLLFILIINGFLFSDIQIIQDVTIEKYNSRSVLETTYTVGQTKWIKDNFIVIIRDDHRTILDLSNHQKKKNSLIYIDNKKKEYYRSTFPLVFKKLLPEELLAIRINSLPKVKIKKLKFEEKVGKYNCKIHTITLNFMMMMIRIKVWASEEPFKENINSNKIIHDDLISGNLLNYFYPNLPDDEKKSGSFYNKLKKIKGLWIRSTVEMDLLIKKIRIITELKKISYKNASHGIFTIPDNYSDISVLPESRN